jgi:hypothetical protein
MKAQLEVQFLDKNREEDYYNLDTVTGDEVKMVEGYLVVSYTVDGKFTQVGYPNSTVMMFSYEQVEGF